MKIYFVRGLVSAQIEISEYVPFSLDGMQSADWVFKVLEDGTVEFLKMRGFIPFRHFFSLERALSWLENWYEEVGFIEFKFAGFKKFDFTRLEGYHEHAEMHDKLNKYLDEGAQ